MKSVIKSLLLCIAFALSSLSVPLSANVQTKNIAQRATAAIGRHKVATAFTCIAGVGLFITHKILKANHANDIAELQERLTALPERERAFIRKTQEFVKSLTIKDVRFEVYGVCIDNGIVDTNKQINDTDIEERYESYEAANSLGINWQAGPPAADIQEKFTQLDTLAGEIKALAQNSPENLPKKRLYIEKTQEVVRDVLQHLHRCAIPIPAIQRYCQAMTDPAIALTVDYCKAQNAELLTFLRGAGDQYPPQFRLLFAGLQFSLAILICPDRRELEERMVQLRAERPYPQWRALFGPRNNN